MPLAKPKTDKTAPAFENPDAGEGTSVESAGTESAAEAAPAKTTALAAASTRAVGAPAVSNADMRILDSLKDSIRVDFNTLVQVQAVQGTFSDKEKDDSLGDTITMELMSFQDNYVCSPNADEADTELVKFSDDGITAKDGTDMAAHLAQLLLDWPKAKITKRVVLVGPLLERAKGDGLIDELIQLDLAPTSKAMFDRYMANCAWKIKSGKLDPEAAKRIKLTARVAKGSGTIKYTVVDFETAA